MHTDLARFIAIHAPDRRGIVSLPLGSSDQSILLRLSMRQEELFPRRTGQVSSRSGVAILTEKKDGKMAPGPNYITVGRNLAMELVRVTEVLSQHTGFFCS